MGNSSFFRLKTSKINFSLYLLGDKYKIDEDKLWSEHFVRIDITGISLIPIVLFKTFCNTYFLETKFGSESTHE